jgi:hypothetical protein
VRTQESDIKTTGRAHSRALVIVAPSAHIRLVRAKPKMASRQGVWDSQYCRGERVQRAAVTAVNDGFKFPARLTMAVGEVVELLIATSGTLVVVAILLTMAMMMRAIRALLRR